MNVMDITTVKSDITFADCLPTRSPHTKIHGQIYNFCGRRNSLHPQKFPAILLKYLGMVKIHHVFMSAAQRKLSVAIKNTPSINREAIDAMKSRVLVVH